MARSLELSCEEKEFGYKGTENAPFEIMVTVDGQKNNASFTVTPITGDWCTYMIEREESFGSNDGYVKILINVPKNLSTDDRFATLKIEHNCAKIVKYINLYQKGNEYSITAEYDDSGWVFKSIPDELFEEKTITLEPLNGSKKWYIKEIQQYHVFKSDKFNDKTEEYVDTDEQNNLMSQIRIPYDSVFNYRIDKNKLIIRSYGQIDLITERENEADVYFPHMRYFFVLSHNDVSKTNYSALDDKKIKYEQKKLFIFDGNKGQSRSYGDDDSDKYISDFNPSVIDSYKFLINGTSSPAINVVTEGETIMISVTSTKNGEVYNNYTVENDLDWCTINNEGTTLIVNKNDDRYYREGTIVYTQNREDSTSSTIKLKIGQDAVSDTWTFTVNGHKNSFTVPQLSASESSYEVEVISKRNDTDMEYTVSQKILQKWAHYNNGTFTFDSNPYEEEREVAYIFKQGGGSKLNEIVVIFSQAAYEGDWEFTIEPSIVTVPISGETILIDINGNDASEENIQVTSKHNGDAVDFTAIQNGLEWMAYDSSPKTIVVSPNEKSERSGVIEFVQDDSGLTLQLTIQQEEVPTNILSIEDDEITVPWEGQYYEDIYVKVYSYDIVKETMTAVDLVDFQVQEGDFITDIKSSGPYDDDPLGIYYKVTVTVEQNKEELPRTGVITIYNEYHKEINVTVAQCSTVVDMGNGILWATTNIDRIVDGSHKLAINPWDYGCYFSWGDIVGHNSTEHNDGYDFSKDNYSSGLSGSGYSLTADIPSGDPTYDTATATLGENWRMPTYDELHWLIDNCNPTWTTLNGVKGKLFTNPNDSSKTLFFPEAGFYFGTDLRDSGSYGLYWSTKYDYGSYAWPLSWVDFTPPSMSSVWGRYDGLSVRAVKIKEPYVDMGNGVLWATSNITRTADGNYKLAANPEDYGCYFSWGDVVGHNSTEYNDDYDFSSRNYSSGASGLGHNLTTHIPSGDPTYDTATATLGGSWRMPTYDECKWLIDNCNPTWTTLNGVNGELFTNPNDSSKTIFFPAAGSYDGATLSFSGRFGYCWSANCNDSGLAYNLLFNSSSYYMPVNFRYVGYSVRAVKIIKEPYVDMGNGVLWATSNITRNADGSYKLADNPWDYGCYFSWGDVVGHNSTEYNDGYSFDDANYNSGLLGNGYNLATDIPSGDSIYDAATATLGGNWRMPTDDEFQWLIDNCNPTWTTMNGVNGRLFTNPNDPSKTLFFPAAGDYSGTALDDSGSGGYYWSTKYGNSSYAYYLYFHSSGCYMDDYLSRKYGFSVRGVQ